MQHIIFFFCDAMGLVGSVNINVCVCCDIIDAFKQDAKKNVPEDRVVPEKQCKLAVILQ